FSGFRSATLQVIATRDLAAVVGADGLGRFLIDGQKIRDYPADGRRLARGRHPRSSSTFSGFRSATLQVIATRDLAAVVGADGLGRFLIDG
ncbi:hypothetical protein CTI14_64535, partial [Methylobacterium radiotolerans]